MYSPAFASVGEIRDDVAEFVKPPRRIPVSEAVADTLFVAQSKPWELSVAPYMREILDTTSSLEYEAVVFAKPARTGGTKALVDGVIAYHVTSDPARILIYFPTETNAADYSRSELTPAHRFSKQLADAVSPRAHDNTIMTRMYRNGMMASILWPTSANVAQRTARVVVLSDYDSMPETIDGGDSPFDSGKKRVQVAMSAGMVIAESNPKRVITSSDWTPQTTHEAPPTDGGIMSLYNRGDRRRWYWQCIHCGEWLLCPPLPDFDPHEDIDAASSTARVVCSVCGGVHEPENRRALNIAGRWLPDRCKFTQDGEIAGNRIKSSIASFWLVGCGAAFMTWQQLVREHLTGIREYERTGRESKLKNTANGDQGIPYLPRSMRSNRTAEQLQSRAEAWAVRTVPEDVRYLITSVDVQGNRFVAQVVGHGIDDERWLIDRFQIEDSPTRKDLDGKAQPIDPSAYTEDWLALAPLAHERYPLADGSGRAMVPRLVVIDSGGRAGPQGLSSVTSRAYDFWRTMRRRGHRDKFLLLKGHPGGDAKPQVWRTFPDSKRKDRHAGAMGDIPIHWLNALVLKDALDRDLKREEIGPGYIHLPEWIDQEVFAELCAEVRNPKRWDKTGRNEAWDLLVYDSAAVQILGWLTGGWKTHKPIDWDNPPRWATEWAINTMVTTLESQQPVKRQVAAKKPAPSAARASSFGKDGWNL